MWVHQVLVPRPGPKPLDLKMEKVKVFLGLSHVRFLVTLDPPIPFGIIYAYGSR